MKILSNIIILGTKPVGGIKSLGPVSNIPLYDEKTILDIQLQNLKKKFACDNIIYIGGYMGDRIKFPLNKNQQIRYIHNPAYGIKNNGYNLKLALPYLKYNTSLIFFNKTVFHTKVFEQLSQNGPSCILTDTNPKNIYRIGFNIDKQTGLINNLFYGLDYRTCGVYFINKIEHTKFKTILLNKKNIDNNFVFEIINEIIDYGGKFKPINVPNKFIKQIDSGASLKHTIRYYAKNFST